jgi:hypothetical protein
MKKIRLALEDLSIQSFSTGEPTHMNGTVYARQESEAADCITGDPNQATCVEYGCGWATGNNTCDASCYCLSADCGGSAGCATGGYCYGSFYASGARC